MLRLLQGSAGQDRRCAPGDGGRGRGRATGGQQAGDSRPPALRADGPSLQRWPQHRAPDRPRQGVRAPRLLAALAEAAIHVAVGTHALFQESVVFADLGLAVVDERHRLWRPAAPRPRLQGRGRRSLGDDRDAHPAFASCSPISATWTSPREKPPDASRSTRASCRSNGSRRSLRNFRALRSGARAYWICPLVEESETLDVAAAEDRAAACARFSARPSNSCAAGCRPGAGRCDGALPTRGDQDPGRDHGGRGRRRRP